MQQRDLKTYSSRSSVFENMDANASAHIRLQKAVDKHQPVNSTQPQDE